MSEFGERLKQARRLRGLTQEKLARLADLSVNTVIKLETAVYQPRPETARKLARALDVSVLWLLFGEGPMEAQPERGAAEQGAERDG